MIFKLHHPAYPLSTYIQHIIYAKGSQPLPYLMELPDGKLNLMIELESESVNTMFTDTSRTTTRTMKHAWVSGISEKAVTYLNNNNSAILSIRFAIGGFYALTRIPMSEIIQPGLEVELLLGSSFNNLYQVLINEKTIEKLFVHLENYFMNYISDNSFESSVVKFIDNNLDSPIDWLVHKSGYSQKHLIHTLKKQAGFSPKYLQRLKRFHAVLNHMSNCSKVTNWTTIAYSFGYYDQAHFIKDFVHFTGVSPAAYFQMQMASEHNKVIKDILLL